MKTPAASESMCPASASSARDPDRAAPDHLDEHHGQGDGQDGDQPAAVLAGRGDARGVVVVVSHASRLVPTEFVQPVVVDSEVVGDLVDHRHGDFLHHVLAGGADVQDGLAVNGDPVRQ